MSIIDHFYIKSSLSLKSAKSKDSYFGTREYAWTTYW